MTVSAQDPINRSTGNGVTTVFPYSFRILAAADLEVTVDGVVKTLTTHYSVSGVGDDGGGNVTFVTAPANGTAVVRRRAMALVRDTDFQDQGELPADTLDRDLDAAVMMIQQVDEKSDLALSLPISSGGIVSAEVPTPVGGSFLGWNALGTALQNYAGLVSTAVSSAMEPVISAATLALARAAFGATAVGEALFMAASKSAARAAIGCNPFAYINNESQVFTVGATYVALGGSVSPTQSGSCYSGGVFTAPAAGFVRCKIAQTLCQALVGTPGSSFYMELRVRQNSTNVTPSLFSYPQGAAVSAQGGYSVTLGCSQGDTFQWYGRLQGTADNTCSFNAYGIEYEYIAP